MSAPDLPLRVRPPERVKESCARRGVSLREPTKCAEVMARIAVPAMMRNACAIGGIERIERIEPSACVDTPNARDLVSARTDVRAGC